MRVAGVGAGIAGLTTACALAVLGTEAKGFERRSTVAAEPGFAERVR